MPISNLETYDQVTVDSEDNLEHFPQLIKSSFSQLILGDLHANALKLLHFLLKYGIVYWPNELDPPSFYKNFAKLYSSINWLSEGLEAQNSINVIYELLSQLKVNINAPKLIFLGDELADRGCNDLITLWLFNHLAKNGIDYICCYSNHTHEFILHYENYIKTLTKPYTSIDCYNSMLPLYRALNRGVIDHNGLVDLVSTHMSRMRLLSYGLNNSGLMQYTHAPTSYNIAQHLAQKLGLFYLDSKPEYLAWSIERINRTFSERIELNNVSELFTKEVMDKLSLVYSQEEKSYPFENIIWNRYYPNLNRPETHPLHHYELLSTHGHDSEDPKNGTNVNVLDSTFGKLKDSFYSDGGMNQNPISHSNRVQLSKERVSALTLEIIEMIRAQLFKQLYPKLKTNSDNIALLKEYGRKYHPLLKDSEFSSVHDLIRDCIMRPFILIDEELFSEKSTASLEDLRREINNLQLFIHKEDNVELKLKLQQYLSQWQCKLREFNTTQASLYGSRGLFTKLINAVELTHGFEQELSSLITCLSSFIQLLKADIPLAYKKETVDKEYQTQIDSEFQKIYTSIIKKQAEATSTINLLNLSKSIAQALNIPLPALHAELEKLASNFESASLQIDLYCKLKDLLEDQYNSVFISQIKKMVEDSIRYFSNQDVCLQARINLLVENTKAITALAKSRSEYLCYSLNKIQPLYELERIELELKLLEPILGKLTQIKEKLQAEMTTLNNLAEPIRCLLKEICSTYLSHLNDKNNEAKINPVKDLIAYLTNTEMSSPKAIQAFQTQFDKHKDLLASRTTMMGVAITPKGHANNVIGFFAGKAGLPRCIGERFVKNIEAVLTDYKIYLKRLEIPKEDTNPTELSSSLYWHRLASS